MSILINRDIPKTMTDEGLKYLAMMAKTIPENGVIVEIGPLYGSSTWVLAMNSHPSVRVFSIDTWERAPWIEKFEKKHPGIVPFSKDAFLHYTKDCKNVIPIQGWSPDVVKDTWSDKIDLFFDDASHGNPCFINNLNFFVPHVKPGGIVCGDDYARGWPDIVKEVDILAYKWKTTPEVRGRVWAMMRPMSDGMVKPVYDLLPKEENSGPLITFSVITRTGRKYQGSPQCWAGALHKIDPIVSLTPSLIKNNYDVSLTVKMLTNSGHMLLWSSDVSNQSLTVRDSEYFTGFACSLHGKDSSKFKINYQVGACDLDRGRLIENSKSHSAPTFIFVEPQYALTAVRVAIEKREAKILPVRI